MPHIAPRLHVAWPRCGGDQLRVVILTWAGSIPLEPGGFAFADARFSSTEDEIVECQTCPHRLPPDAITL